MFMGIQAKFSVHSKNLMCNIAGVLIDGTRSEGYSVLYGKYWRAGHRDVCLVNKDHKKICSKLDTFPGT